MKNKPVHSLFLIFVFLNVNTFASGLITYSPTEDARFIEMISQGKESIEVINNISEQMQKVENSVSGSMSFGNSLGASIRRFKNELSQATSAISKTETIGGTEYRPEFASDMKTILDESFGTGGIDSLRKSKKRDIFMQRSSRGALEVSTGLLAKLDDFTDDLSKTQTQVESATNVYEAQQYTNLLLKQMIEAIYLVVELEARALQIMAGEKYKGMKASKDIDWDKKENNDDPYGMGKRTWGTNDFMKGETKCSENAKEVGWCDSI